MNGTTTAIMMMIMLLLLLLCRQRIVSGEQILYVMCIPQIFPLEKLFSFLFFSFLNLAQGYSYIPNSVPRPSFFYFLSLIFNSIF